MRYLTIIFLFIATFATGQQQMFLRSTPAAGVTGILDSYTGSAAAYATALLYSGYSGSCLRVRRDSDNAEQDIGFSGQDIDEAAIASFCSGANCFVKTWYDQSGNGNDLTQATAANQPKIYDSSTGIIYQDGITALDFNGSSNYLQFLGTLSFSNYINFFGSVKYDVASNNDAWIGISDNAYSASDHWLLIRTNITGIAYITTTLNAGDPNGRVITTTTSAAIPSSTTFVSAQYETDGSNVSLTLYVNGALDETASNTVTPTYSFSQIDYDLSVGSAINNGSPILHADIKTQFVVIFNSDQSANRTAIENAINNYYNIY